MCKKCQCRNYKVEIVQGDQLVALKPSCTRKDAIHWANRIKELGGNAYITLAALVKNE